MTVSYSVIVPVLNEQDSLEELFAQLSSAAEELQNGPDPILEQWEVVFIDDGSTDQSWKKIESISADSRARGIRFRRNFGKAAALNAGIAESRFPIVITMDADLQDDPAEIPRMLEALGDGQDVVSGWKQVRHDPIGKTFPSKVFNWLVGWLTGVRLHDHNCGFKIYRREVFDEIQLYGEMHRFIPVLAADRGFRIGEIPVAHRARQHGVSKYGWRRIYRGLLDLLTVVFLTNYRYRPQHLLGALGGGSFLLGSLGLMVMAVYWVLRQMGLEVGPPLHERPVVLYSVGLMLLGAQLLSVGVLAELILAQSSQRQSAFSIRQKTG